jgi:hypothetical protein
MAKLSIDQLSPILAILLLLFFNHRFLTPCLASASYFREQSRSTVVRSLLKLASSPADRLRDERSPKEGEMRIQNIFEFFPVQ